MRRKIKPLKLRPQLAGRLKKAHLENKIKQNNVIWVRIFHWGFSLSVMNIILTGFYIHQPFRYINISQSAVYILHITSSWFALGFLSIRIADMIIRRDKSFILTKRDLKNIPQFLAYNFFLKDKLPPSGKYNVGEKIIFCSWIILVIVASILGIISYTEGKVFNWLYQLLGGFQSIRWTKYIINIYFACTIPLHIYLVLTQNLSRLQSMITGYERKP